MRYEALVTTVESVDQISKEVARTDRRHMCLCFDFVELVYIDNDMTV